MSTQEGLNTATTNFVDILPRIQGLHIAALRNHDTATLRHVAGFYALMCPHQPLAYKLAGSGLYYPNLPGPRSR